MKTFISELIPKLNRFSQKLDNLALLTNQHWVAIDDISNSKILYIFRTNNDLLISRNGTVEKAKWEYLGNNSLLIDQKNESYLFKHGFFDENILALKIDGKNEYAILINENKYDGEINSIEKVIDFLTIKYSPYLRQTIEDDTGIIFNHEMKVASDMTLIERGQIQIEVQVNNNTFNLKPGQRVFMNWGIAPNGKYKVDKPIGYWMIINLLYQDVDSCLKALHYYHVSNKILGIGLLNNLLTE